MGCVRGLTLNLLHPQLAGAGSQESVGCGVRSADGGPRAECISSTEIEKMLLLESMVSSEAALAFVSSRLTL